MGRDHPDGTSLTLKAELVATLVVPEIAANETPISETEGKVTTTSSSYQTLASWTVAAAKNGILYGVELYAVPFATALFQLTIGGVVQWTGIEFPTGLNMIFSEARLAAGTVVLLEGKSSDATSVSLWGHIEGKEVG